MSQAISNKYLGEEKLSRLLLKFSIPCIMGLLISALYNIVDQIFIGNSELGYLGKNFITGSFGEKTQAAVEEFQKAIKKFI